MGARRTGEVSKDGSPRGLANYDVSGISPEEKSGIFLEKLNLRPKCMWKTRITLPKRDSGTRNAHGRTGKAGKYEFKLLKPGIIWKFRRKI